MRKTARLALFAPAAIAAALLALSSDRGPLRAREAQAAVDPQKDKNYDLASLDVFRKTIVQIKDNYVDPSRINPKEMFTAALEAVERQVAEVMVEVGGPPCDDRAVNREPGTAMSGPANAAQQGGILETNRAQAAGCGHANASIPENHVRVTVGNATREFDYRDIDSIWQIPLKMHEVFSFVRDNLVTQSDQREIEYAAINGMLSTLDPHSWLLKPDVYKEMKVQTRGEFGGLGFVISMIEDKLTVRKVLKNTPAWKGGVKKGDVITQIDNDSTVSMELQEAVDRMRGKPGTKVSIWVAHKGAEPKRLDLTRALVTYETVVSKLLDNGVGYVRLSGFSGTTTRDMIAAIRSMKQQNGGSLRGLVLDMRGNPGGLLEQAIQVSDAFVEEGTIVTTVGVNGTLREPKLARADGGEREFPMAVLISSESASASEIVAGALKNLNRAVIVGRQSFGKGSVQVLYDFKDRETGDESALKLTIAQYLTPGDVSIQEVGIVPDIELVPARILKDRIDLFAPPKTFREADYDKHFFNGFARDEEQAKAGRERVQQKPFETLRFVKEETAKERKNRELIEAGQAPEEDDDDPSDEDGVVVDYQIEFCRDLLLHASSTDRRQQLQQAKPFVEQRRGAEQEKVRRALEAMGLNWSAQAANAPKVQAARVQAEIRAPRTQAGGTMEMTVTAHNSGTTTLSRLRAYTKSDNAVLDRREFVFGQLQPGEKRTWTVPIKIPRYMPSRRDDVTLKWEDDTGDQLEEARAETDIAELPRPAFAWSYQIVGTDGLLHKGEKGETAEIIVDVKNVGTGTAFDAYAALRNLSEDRINVKKGRTKLGPLKPGETKSATFVLEVKKPLEDTVPVRLEVGDKELYEAQRDKLLLPAAPPIPLAAAQQPVRVQVDTAILATAQESGAKLATVKKGAVLSVHGKAGLFWRVEWEKGRMGFLPLAAGKETPAAKPNLKTVAQVMQSEAPAIRLGNVDTSRGGVETDQDHLTLSGSASDVNGMRDLQIFIQHENDYRKVFFRTARKPGQPATGAPVQLDFQTELPLKPGNSTVVIIAREDDDLQAQRTLVVHRKQPVVAQKQTEAVRTPR
ncbi:MAG: PDZ domain-containing protein [Deltaproteobacteria bacterium]|nr:MAG: PDZ domain-containing protein [Deltaproteobacteria bacterium]